MNPMQAVAASPAPPTGLFDLPSYTPQPGQADPRDAGYWSNLAKLRFSREQEYAQGLAAQQRADLDYGDSVQTAIRNRAVQQRSLGEDAIRGNLGASGWLNRNEAEQTTAYTQERSRAQRAKEEDDQGRTAAQKALLQMFQLEAGDLLSEAGQRYAEAQAYAAANEEPLVGLPPAPAVAAAKPAGKGGVNFRVNQPLPNHSRNNPAKHAIASARRARR